MDCSCEQGKYKELTGMKKIIGILCIVLLIGCAKTNPSNNIDVTYLLFATPLEEHPVWLEAKKGFFAACEQENYQCAWIGPKTIDIDEMNDTIQTGILQKADAIITQGVIDENLIKEAQEKQIPVILVDSDMPNSKRTAYFGKDFHNQAELFLQDIEQKVGKDEKLYIAIQVAEESFQIAQDQINQLEEVFQNHDGGFEIVSVTSSKSDQVRAKREWTSIFTEHPNINIALNFAGESVIACYEIAANMDVRDQMLIYGVDDMDDTMQLLLENKIDGTVATSFYSYGFDTVMFYKDYASKSQNQKKGIIPAHIQMVTPENAEEYLNEKSNK